MYCEECGKEIRDTAKFCPYCGTTVTLNTPAMTAVVFPSEAAETKTISETAAEIIADTKKENEQEASVIIAENANETEADSAPQITAEPEQETQAAEKKEESIVDAEKTSELEKKFNEQDGMFVVKNQSAPKIDIPESIPEGKARLPVKKLAATIICLVVVCAGAVLVPNVIMPAIKYGNAEKLYQNMEYTEAEAVFAELGEYKDSAEYILKCRYGEAEKLFEAGRYPEAADAFTALNGYSDSDARAEKSMLAIAEAYINAGDYNSAVSIYAAAGKSELAEEMVLKEIDKLVAEKKYFEAAEIAEDFCDEETVTEYRYLGAMTLKESGDHSNAAAAFAALGSYKDSEAQTEECTYSHCMSSYTVSGVSEEVVRGFFDLGTFRNSRDMFLQTSYEYGTKCMESGDYSMAAAMFRNCGSYKSAVADLHMARYSLGKKLLDSDPASARSVFALLSTYSDSAKQKKAAAARIPNTHADWYADGFTQAGDYFTTAFRKTDTLVVNCTAGTDTISQPITLTLTFADSSGATITADCEDVRNSGSFSGSFSLSNAAAGDAVIVIARKDNGVVLRTINITVVE